jgi:hypothetical protein
MFLMRWHSPDGDYAVDIEDDDRVAYAYLLQGERIVADIWLYNAEATPTEPEWADREKLPFLNPASFAFENNLGPIRGEDDVEVLWSTDGKVSALVRLFGIDWAILAPGAKPGWCRLAKRNGRLANLLDEFG